LGIACFDCGNRGPEERVKLTAPREAAPHFRGRHETVPGTEVRFFRVGSDKGKAPPRFVAIHVLDVGEPVSMPPTHTILEPGLARDGAGRIGDKKISVLSKSNVMAGQTDDVLEVRKDLDTLPDHRDVFRRIPFKSETLCRVGGSEIRQITPALKDNDASKFRPGSIKSRREPDEPGADYNDVGVVRQRISRGMNLTHRKFLLP
jgi:hypothetical protein